MRRLFEGGAYLKIGRDKEILLEAKAENKLLAQVTGKKKERSWACCAGKVHGLHSRTTYCKNSR